MESSAMNTLIAKIIAFELGILIAILTWTAFSNSSNRKDDLAQATEEPPESSFASISPVYQPNRPRAVPAVDYLAEDQSRDVVENEPAQSMQTYQPQVIDQPYDDSGYYDYAPPADASNYIGTYPEPVLGLDYYGWPYGGFVTYAPATQVVVIRSPRSCGRAINSPGSRTSHPRMRPQPRRTTRLQPTVTRAGQRTTRPGSGSHGGFSPRQPVSSRTTRPRQATRVAWNR
jgi:hypothetical protein